MTVMSDYTPMTKKQVALLARHLDDLISRTIELGCTCVDRSKGHQRGCTGVRVTAKARAYLTRLRGKSYLR